MRFLRSAKKPRCQLGPAAPEVAHLPAEKFNAPVDVLRLALVHRLEAYALGSHPHERRSRVVYKYFSQIGITSILRDTPHVFEKVLTRVGAEIDNAQFFVGEFEDFPDLLDVIKDPARRTRDKKSIAAAFVKRRRLEHDGVGTGVFRSKGSTQSRIARADDDDVRAFDVFQLHVYSSACFLHIFIAATECPPDAQLFPSVRTPRGQTRKCRSRWGRERIDANGRVAFTAFGCVDGRRQRAVQTGNGCGGGANRHHDAQPIGRLQRGKTLFARRRDIRQKRGPRLPGHSNRAKLAGFDERQWRRQIGNQERHIAADEICESRRRALICDMLDIHLRQTFEQFEREMRKPADSR